MPSRRQLLAGLTTAACCALAGCGTADDSRSTTATRTSTPRPPGKVGDERPVGDGRLTLTRVGTRSAVVIHGTDSMWVDVPDGRYVVVGLRSQGTEPPSEDFELAVGDRSFEPADLRAGSPYGLLGWEVTHWGDTGPGGWLAFEVPAPLPDGAVRLHCREAAWMLPERVLRRLRRPRPAWTLHSFDVPGSLSHGESFQMGVSVQNTAGFDATFRGAVNVAGLNYAYYPYPFAIDVPAGERRTWTKALTVPEDFDSDDEPDFRLVTPAGSRVRSPPVTSG